MACSLLSDPAVHAARKSSSRWKSRAISRLGMYNVMFGTDSNTENYNTGWAKEWLERDKELFHRFELDQRPGFLEHIYRQNLLRFLGKSDEQPVKKIPLVGQ